MALFSLRRTGWIFALAASLSVRVAAQNGYPDFAAEWPPITQTVKMKPQNPKALSAPADIWNQVLASVSIAVPRRMEH